MDLPFELKRINYRGYYIDIYETGRVLMGFTENRFPSDELAGLFSLDPANIFHLTQVHSDTVHFVSELEPGTEKEGDGIVLDRPGKMGVIQTADCTPMFLWHPAGTLGAVLHIGWRGLLQGIELEMLRLFKERNIAAKLDEFYVYLGPAIEGKCYAVGEDLFLKFSAKIYRDEIFTRSRILGNESGTKLELDIKKGILLSLMAQGIPRDHIIISPLCTFCEPDRFPSYRRRQGTGERIYNFLMLK